MTRRARPGNKLNDVFKNTVHHKDPTQCCEYTAYRDKDGYGKFTIKHKRIGAHVAAYCASRGFTLEDLCGKCVLHTCDNPSCINPVHLFLGTSVDNNADRHKKGRSARGESDGNSKCTDNEVRIIRASNEMSHVLAKRFGLSPGTIRNIRYGRTWKHVT